MAVTFDSNGRSVGSLLPCAHCEHPLGVHTDGPGDACTAPVEPGSMDDWNDDGVCPCADFDH